MKPRVIVFVGTVGSGKSTQMRLLVSELERREIRVKATFLKSNHILAYLLEALLAKILVSKKNNDSPIRALIEEKPHIFKKIFKLWMLLDVVSIGVKLLFNIYLPLKLGYTVLVEEYIPATISDYIYLSKVVSSTLKLHFIPIRFLLKLANLSRPIYIVFLDADDYELKVRWRLRGGPDERDDYLNMQRTTLLWISKILSCNKVLYIRNETIRRTHQLIKEYLLDINNV